jgi:cytochrome c
LPKGPLVAVAFAGDVPVMQLREPSRLVFGDRGLSLPGDSVTDTGDTIFHLQTGSGLACASCHPEGQEDGHVWNFAEVGPRRTQSLRGGLIGSEPFHWDGLETNIEVLTGDVMAGRMAGPLLTAGQADLLLKYLDRLPALTLPEAASELVVRGKAVFEDETVGCATCHSGPRFTNNETVDVGQGPLQVPGLLGLWARAPFLHDGCASTLTERFTLCDTGVHGDVKNVDAEDLKALVAYLESL